MTPSDLSSSIPDIITIEVMTPARTRANKLLKIIAPYFVVPIATGVLFVSVVAAVAHPIAAVISCIVVSAVAGPSLDIWRRRHRKAQRNDALKGASPFL